MLRRSFLKQASGLLGLKTFEKSVMAEVGVKTPTDLAAGKFYVMRGGRNIVHRGREVHIGLLVNGYLAYLEKLVLVSQDRAFLQRMTRLWLFDWFRDNLIVNKHLMGDPQIYLDVPPNKPGWFETSGLASPSRGNNVISIHLHSVDEIN